VKAGQDGFFWRLFKNIFFCCFNKEDFYNFERAAEPSDIYWENLNVGGCGRFFRMIASLIAMAFVSGICFAAIFGLTRAQKSTRPEVYSGEATGVSSLYYTPSGGVAVPGSGTANNVISQVLGILIAVIITVINTLLSGIMKSLALFERKHTLTEFNVSVAYKLTIARFLNSALLLVFASIGNETTWFNTGGLVNNATTNIITLSLVEPGTKIIVGVIKAKVFKCFAKCNKEITQKNANIICEGPTIEASVNISTYMNIFCTCIFYSPLIPHTIPLACFATI